MWLIQTPTARGHQGNRIPSWMPKQPVFCYILKLLDEEHQYPADPCGALAAFKLILEKSKKGRLFANSHVRHLTAWEPSYWTASTALRAYRNNRSCDVARRGNLLGNASTQSPLNVPTSAGSADHCCPHSGKPCRTGSRNREPPLDTDRERQCYGKVQAWTSSMVRQEPMLCLHAVTDEDGHPLENEEESGRRLCDCWGTIFQVRAEGPKHHRYENILRYVQKAPGDIRWVMTKMNLTSSWLLRRNPLLVVMEFRTAFTDVREVWVRGFCFVHTNMCWTVVLLPELFAEIRTVFVPISSDVDNNGWIIRSPEALRPLTLCKCDCKILTTATCRGLHWYTMRCIHPRKGVSLPDK